MTQFEIKARALKDSAAIEEQALIDTIEDARLQADAIRNGTRAALRAAEKRLKEAERAFLTGKPESFEALLRAMEEVANRKASLATVAATIANYFSDKEPALVRQESIDK